MDRETIEATQLHLLRRLLKSLVPSNKFYAPRIAASGISVNCASLKAFSRDMGLTTKSEIAADQRDNPPYGTNLTYPLHHYTRYHQTSGTTGAPIRWLDTEASWRWMTENWMEVYRSGDVTAEDIIFFTFSFGPFLGFWTAFDAATRLGAMCIPGGGMTTAGRLQTLLENDVTVLCCTPTYALRLGEMAQEEGIDISRSKLKRIIVAGEPGASLPTVRAQIERLWNGARLLDHHGMTEVGPVSYECPAQPGILHIIEPSYIAEVINPVTGEPCDAGNEGELVLTVLGRVGSPLLRYRTGDLVRFAKNSPCECGTYRTGLEGGILGRVDDMVIIRGVNLHPSGIEEIIRRFAEVSEYQVEVWTERGMPEISITIEPMVGCQNQNLPEALETSLRAAYHLRIPVRMVTPGTLPRFEMKARRWLRK